MRCSLRGNVITRLGLPNISVGRTAGPREVRVRDVRTGRFEGILRYGENEEFEVHRQRITVLAEFPYHSSFFTNSQVSSSTVM